MFISCKNFSLIVDDKVLIKESDFIIGEKEKVGLIGRNGSGKSTFLEVIFKKYTGEKLEEEIQIGGQINLNQNLKIAYLKQEIKFNFQGGVEEYLNQCQSFYSKIIKRFEELSFKKKKASLTEKEETELKDIIQKMNFYGLWKYQVRRNKILENLNIKNLLNKNLQNISGGEATRVGLAGILLSEADFWILDEPTNNLDYLGVNLLLEEINNFKGGVLIVTHDRKILDQLNKIIEIDEETKQIRIWGGNYSFYKKKKQEEYEARMRKYLEQREKKALLEKEIKRLKSIALEIEKKGGTKGVKLAKRAKSIETRIEREFSKLNEPKPPERPKFPLPQIEPVTGTFCRFINVSFSYPDGKKVFENLNFEIDCSDRVLIKGKNGSGKTTLLELIWGNLEPSSGEIFRKQNLKICYLPQTPLISNEKIKDYLRNLYHLTTDEIKKILNLIKVSYVYNLEVKNLSIGEIRRIQLASILFKNPEVLILDEPTNHLDVYTIEDLTFVLKDYSGTLIFTSHDDYFIKDIKPNKIIQLD